MTNFLNDEPFSYLSNHGTHFAAEHSDFRGGLTVTKRRGGLREEFFANDLAEMIAHHCLFVRPRLVPFAGYDCIKFTIREAGADE